MNSKQAHGGGNNSGTFLTLDNLNTSNIVTAKKSSYYCLTPASSTTSLSDLNQSKSLLEDFSSANSTRQKKSVKTKQYLSSANIQAQVEESGDETRPNSKKRTRLSIDTYKCADLDSSTNLNNKLTHTLSATTFMQPTGAVPLSNREVSVVGGRGRRGRGRPPKNANLILGSTQASLIVNSNHLNGVNESVEVVTNVKQFEDCEEKNENKKEQEDMAPLANATKANSKLIKSLINKSSSNSNLQKSKVQVDSNENKTITKNDSSSNLLQKKSIVSLNFEIFPFFKNVILC